MADLHPVTSPAARPSDAGAAQGGAPAPSGAGRLELAGLDRLLGYSATLASVALTRPLARQLAKLDLKIVEFSILMLVDGNAEVRQKQLGETLDVAPPNLAVVLDRMVAHGWVRRERSERDRRVQLVRITPAGQALVRRARRIGESTEAALVRVLSADEKANLIEMLQRVVDGSRRPADANSSRGG